MLSGLPIPFNPFISKSFALFEKKHLKVSARSQTNLVGANIILESLKALTSNILVKSFNSQGDRSIVIA